MKHGIIIILLTLLCLQTQTEAEAETYYLDDDGSDTSLGNSVDAPWRTWEHAFTMSTCGDKLIVMDGTYTRAINGTFRLSKSCTPGATYTVIAQNERQAFLNGDGVVAVISINNSAYVTVQGFRVKCMDNPSGRSHSNVMALNSNHITFKRLLVSHDNRNINSHLIQLSDTTSSVLEENELYFFHRHGILLNKTTNSVMRRNYCNARNYPGIPGGYDGVSGDNGTGDDCIVVYPGDDNIIENNIADGTMLKAFSVQARGAGRGNKFLGNIALGPTMGLSLDVRTGSGSNYMPRDTVVENMIVINASDAGIRSRGAKNTRCNQCMVLSSRHGFWVDMLASAPGDGEYSFFSNNSLVLGGNSGTGFYVTSQIQTWEVNSSNSFKNLQNYTPSSNPSWINYRTIDPLLGTCRVWIPDFSPMKRAGINSKDIGANILYRYKDGVLTKVPLWDPSTGKFPSGALIAGLNDVPGQSLFDVHNRLNVNTNGCLFPAGYGSGGSDADSPRSPQSLRAS